jgi:anaerobic selenocysteine-containing dehydrogenase
MNVSRRGFLKLSGAIAAASGLGISLKPIYAHAQELNVECQDIVDRNLCQDIVDKVL